MLNAKPEISEVYENWADYFFMGGQLVLFIIVVLSTFSMMV